MEDLAVLQREHAALRHRVLRLLESCAGELVHGAQLSPHGPLPVSPHLPQPPRAPLPPRGPIPPAPDPHAELQRGLLDFLVVRGATLALPASAAALLSLTVERHPELSRYEVGAGNVTRALFELQNLVPAAVRVEQGELAFLDATALSAFQDRLLGRPSAGASAGTAGGGDKGGRKRTATAAHDSELAAVMDLVGTKSAKEKERQEQADELLELLHKPTARQASETDRFRTAGGSKLQEFCRHGTKEDCARLNGTGMPCGHIHFRRIIKPHTDVSLGDCSYLDTCRHMATCRFIHYEVDHTDAQRMRQGSAQLDPFARTATNRVDDDPFSRHYESQFVNCDIRTFPMQTLGKFPVIMADPPWDIHMELPYGTMSDDEMRRMNVQVLPRRATNNAIRARDTSFFLWVSGRAMELGRECLEIWGYRFVQELLWVKTNQLQRIIRTGRTGHWINHSKEHCLIGVKGDLDDRFNQNLDCDVICAEVRETSRKPDEMYDLLERLAPGQRKLELFGRPHNVHKGWTTLGNQLGKTQIAEPWLRQHLLDEGVFEPQDLAPMPTPPRDPLVPPWGGHDPPERLPREGMQ